MKKGFPSSRRSGMKLGSRSLSLWERVNLPQFRFIHTFCGQGNARDSTRLVYAVKIMIYDVTVPITNTMPIWPGDPPVELVPISKDSTGHRLSAFSSRQIILRIGGTENFTKSSFTSTPAAPNFSWNAV